MIISWKYISKITQYHSQLHIHFEKPVLFAEFD